MLVVAAFAPHEDVRACLWHGGSVQRVVSLGGASAGAVIGPARWRREEWEEANAADVALGRSEAMAAIEAPCSPFPGVRRWCLPATARH
eukprot:COSAG01_NODE_18510_length_1071_cov_1.248971_2_plen_89_part_00